MHIRTGLVAEQQAALFGAGIDAGYGRSAFAVAPVVCKCERAPERARDRGRVLPEHRIEERIAGDQSTQSRQRLLALTESCKQSMNNIVRFISLLFLSHSHLHTSSL